jgi:hypothetical protein
MMLESRWSVAAALALTMALGGPVAARAQQGQTLEGAQQFLAITGKSLKARGVYDDGDGFDFQITDMQQNPKNRCVTSFAVPAETGRKAIIWRDVSDVKADGRYVVVRQLDNQREAYNMRIDYQAESLATRAAFAMEFIRQACDPTAGTGF